MDQMIQAARAGKKNILEGSKARAAPARSAGQGYFVAETPG